MDPTMENKDNTTTSSSLLSPEAQIVFTACYALIIAASLVGNILVIHIIRCHSDMRSSTNILILNQSISDLLVTFIYMPTQVKVLFYNTLWIDGVLGLVLCKLKYFIIYGSSSCSVNSLMVIAADRYQAISQPLARTNSFIRRNINKVVPAIWIWSFALIIIAGSLMHSIIKHDKGGRPICVLALDAGHPYTSFIVSMVNVIIDVVVPILVTAILYALIGRLIWTRHVPGDQNNISQQVRLRRTNVKISKMMAAVTLIFAVCWLPFTLVVSVARKSSPYVLYIFAVWLSNAFSAINPWVYLLYNDAFREKLKVQFASGSTSCRFRKNTITARNDDRVADLGQTQANTPASAPIPLDTFSTF